MELKSKIEFVLGLVRESARLQLNAGMTQVTIYPKNHYVLPSGAQYPEEAELVSSEDIEQVLCKFEGDGLITKMLAWDDAVFFEIGTLDIDSDENPYKKSNSGTLILKVKKEVTDLEKGILVLSNGQTIHISGQAGNENNPLRLLKTLMSDIDKEWAEDEILEDWEGVVSDKVIVPKDRVYQAYVNLRKRVESQTGIQDLVSYRNKTYRLNRKYF